MDVQHTHGLIDLDLRGLQCPLPVLRLKKTLRHSASGARLRVLCTDPNAKFDIPFFLRETGDVLEETHYDNDEIIFIIRKA